MTNEQQQLNTTSSSLTRMLLPIEVLLKYHSKR
jgi:hypothetical protein